MNNANKGRSPFYPGHPVPREFFTGRVNEIQRIARAINQVVLKKPQAIFLTGEYGIGKSSLAGMMKYYAEEQKLLGIHVFLGNAKNIEEVATKSVETVINTHAYEHTKGEIIRNWLAKYIGNQDLFGRFTLKLEELKTDGPDISRGYLTFLHDLFYRVKDTGYKGIMLILDEINGITRNEDFAYFIKSINDENSPAISKNPLPLLLMLCGVEERRREMIQCHQPVDRIFDIVDINPMSEDETKEFYYKTFNSVGMKIDDNIVSSLWTVSAGFPKLMHIIGDNIFWIDQDNIIDAHDISKGILAAAEDIGKKFVDQQVLKELKSKDYHSILTKISKSEIGISFKSNIIEKTLTLTEAEKKKFGNFLQSMKKLKVLRVGDEKGEWVFNSALVRLYLHIKPLEKK